MCLATSRRMKIIEIGPAASRSATNTTTGCCSARRPRSRSTRCSTTPRATVAWLAWCCSTRSSSSGAPGGAEPRAPLALYATPGVFEALTMRLPRSEATCAGTRCRWPATCAAPSSASRAWRACAASPSTRDAGEGRRRRRAWTTVGARCADRRGPAQRPAPAYSQWRAAALGTRGDAGLEIADDRAQRLAPPRPPALEPIWPEMRARRHVRLRRPAARRARRVALLLGPTRPG